MAELDSKEELKAQIKALKIEYVDTLPEKKRLIGRLWQRLHRDRFDREVAQELSRRAHNLVGSGGLYGFPGISSAARDIETLACDLLVSEQVSPHVVARFECLFQTLGRSIDDSDPKNNIDR